jgi:hypothetical protein
MVRRVLSVLALLPLLLPPGLCVCHTPTAACTAGAAGSRASLAHLCLSHHGHGDEHGGPHRHAPGCPALKGLDHWLVQPGTAVQAPDLPLAGFTGPADTASPSSVAAPPASARGSPVDSPPLYLTLRTLLL